MSPIIVNGLRLGVERNGAFTSANTAPIPGGRLWTEAAVAYNDMRAAALAAGILPGEFMPTGPASSARTVAQQQFLFDHQPPTAAWPGTSNHGWGLAVDIAGPRAQHWIQGNGMRWRFSWDEGRRVGESWHFRYVGGYQPDKLAHLTQAERRWVKEYDRLRRESRDRDRRRVLRRRMAQQRKEIWRAANRPRAAGGGWDRANRRARYESLKSRTT